MQPEPVEIEFALGRPAAGADEVLAESAWVPRLDRLLRTGRVRATVVAAAAVLAVATFGGTGAGTGTGTGTSTGPIRMAGSAPPLALAPGTYCRYVTAYTHDHGRPGLWTIERQRCFTVAPAQAK